MIDCEALVPPVAVSGNVRLNALGESTGPTVPCPPDGPTDATTGKTCVDCWKNGWLIAAGWLGRPVPGSTSYTLIPNTPFAALAA